jgi:methyl-accepting chemotaxis protein
VKKSEELVARKFEELDTRDITDYVLHRAKSDHNLWKKNLSEMLVGLNSLTEDALGDHQSCRLGKWYGTISDETIKGHPAFAALDKPHAEVHTCGKKAAALFAQGDREGAQAAVSEMEIASAEVIRLLDELLAR